MRVIAIKRRLAELVYARLKMKSKNRLITQSKCRFPIPRVIASTLPIIDW